MHPPRVRTSLPFLKIAHRRVVCCAVLCNAVLCSLVVLLAGCRTETIEPGPVAVSLVRSWAEAEVVDPVPVPQMETRSVVRFGGRTDETEVDGTEADGTGADGVELAGVDWSVIQGIDGLRVEDGALRGTTTSDAAMLTIEYPAPQGADSDLWSIEIRMAASAGTKVEMHPLSDLPQDGPGAPPGSPPVPVMLAGMTGSWPIQIPLQTGTTPKTSTIAMDNVFSLGLPLFERNIQRLVIHPTDAEGADFAIEEIRLVFTDEHLASIESGPGWQGLGEVFRESLVTRTPEEIRYRLDLPSRPWLFLAVGSIEETPPTFHVDVMEEGGEPQPVASWTPETPGVWSPQRLDLSRWAGGTVEIRLRAESESPGDLAYWGSPTVRQASPDLGDRPQVVVVFLADTLRRDHLEAWGYEREVAPTASRLAAEGLRFEHAISQATWTKASVPAILTGLYPSSLGVMKTRDRVSAGETTLAEAFSEAGYATFATSSIPFSGSLSNLHQGVEVMYESTALETKPSEEYHSKTAEPWVGRFVEFLDQHRDVPVFALVHAMDPHSPFRPLPPWDTHWAGDDAVDRFEAIKEQMMPHIEHPGAKFFLAPLQSEVEASGVDADEFIALEKAWYDGSIRAMDDQLARLMESLESHGLSDRSTVAFVSDHGEEFLEHGRHFHGTTVYGELNRVPMFLWGRGVPKGETVEQVVQTIDLAPTLMTLAGLPVPERVQGRSLLGLTAGEARELPAFTERRAQGTKLDATHWSAYSIVSGTWKLVRNDPDYGPLPEDMGELQLFRYDTDPLDQNDVAAEHPEVVERLAAELDRWKTWAESRQLDDAEVAESMSAEELEQLRSLGYID